MQTWVFSLGWAIYLQRRIEEGWAPSGDFALDALTSATVAWSSLKSVTGPYDDIYHGCQGVSNISEKASMKTASLDCIYM